MERRSAMGVFEDVLSQTSRRPGGLSAVLERRGQPRFPHWRASETAMTSHLWELDLVPVAEAGKLVKDIEGLAARSDDRNLFFEPAVIGAIWPRLLNNLAPKGAWILALWETTPKERALRLSMPVGVVDVGFPKQEVLQVLSNDFFTLGTPLIDGTVAGEAVETLLRLLADPDIALPKLIDFRHLKGTDNALVLLHDAANSLGLPTAGSRQHERAALRNVYTQATFLKDGLSPKRAREYRRQMRRLEKAGEITFETASIESDVLDAFEGFIALELQGWKGRRGTALYNQKRVVAFSRQIVAGLARQSACEIFSLKLDDRTIAAVIVLGRDGQVCSWKMTFDEKLASYSPGVLVMLRTSEALLGRETFVEADSMAVADHWMMNNLWPQRIAVQDLAIAATPGGARELDQLIAAKQREDAVRRFARKVRGKLAKWV